MPGRWFIGLSPDEKHPSEFRPSRLPDEPKVTMWLVLGAVVATMAVIAIGYWIDHPASDCYQIDAGQVIACPEPKKWGSDIPMMVWISLGALVATIVLTLPFLVYELKRRMRRL